ncbi:MAG: leucyl aminopeptidase family protein [Clostridia bacterium]|nr:leucyl aminopeptidase family protein [Clostridia bacterium]
MTFQTAAAGCGGFDTVLRLVPAGTKIAFSDKRLQAAYDAVYAADDLRPAHAETVSLRLPMGGGFADVLVTGFDNDADDPYDALRKVFAQWGDRLAGKKRANVLVDALDALTFLSEDEALLQLAATLPLSLYRFDRYLSAPRPVPEIAVTVQTANEAALKEGLLLAEGVMHARDLVNMTAEELTPAAMAERCAELGREYGFETEIFGKAECEAMGMGLLLAVARGSVNEPKFIVMRWNGGPAEEAPVAFVGKGVTYDTGGLAIKTGGSMTSMRFDMNGGASVIGAMCAVAGMRLPHNVVAVVAACENAVDANSYRNGDVYRAMNGKTVFVQNTDAEGRLSMADAITWCVQNAKPSEILEVAGLTGSVCNFYGSVCAAALTRTQRLFDRVASLSPLTGELYAQMPSFPAYRNLLKTQWADLNNSPKGGPGGILAGMFLDCFAEDVPFLHIDYGAMPFTGERGGTGFGVKTLYRYIKTLAD